MLMCSPIKHDVVWKEGWEEHFDDSNRKPQHQQDYGAKHHLDGAEKDTAAVNFSTSTSDRTSSHTQRCVLLTSGTEKQNRRGD